VTASLCNVRVRLSLLKLGNGSQSDIFLKTTLVESQMFPIFGVRLSERHIDVKCFYVFIYFFRKNYTTYTESPFITCFVLPTFFSIFSATKIYVI